MPICDICKGKGSFNKNIITNDDIPCWLCNGTGHSKRISLIYSKAIKRRAIKKTSICEGCKGKITIGCEYYDTKEIKDIWATYKYCISCWTEKDKE